MYKKKLPNNIQELQEMLIKQDAKIKSLEHKTKRLSSEKISLESEKISLESEKISLESEKTSLESEKIKLESEKTKLASEKKRVDIENLILREQVQYFKALKFAPKSEQFIEGQGTLFDEFEEAIEEIPPKELEVKGHTRDQNRGKRKPLPVWLPREERIIDLDESDKICPHDGTKLHLIGEEVSESLKIIPAKISVVKTIRKKYACKTCSDVVKTAPTPLALIPKSIATPSLIAWIATSKYVDGLPLYRIENVSKRFGFELKRNTMSRWMISVADKLAPLRKILEEELIASDYVHCDETTVQVLKEKGKKATSKSYMWLQGRAGPKPIILFNYSASRGGAVPKKLFEHFHGYLQTDGYSGYTQFAKSENITLMGCMAHMRRKFYDAWISAKKKKSGAAYIVLGKIKKIYKVEEELKNKIAPEIYTGRQEKSRKLVDDLFKYVESLRGKYPSASLLGKAITYATNQEKHLKVFLDDGKLSIDNNFIERAVRPFAVGRNAWKFSASTSGADASALWYSLIETAKMNNVEPFEYLNRVLEKLPHVETLDDYLELLPFKID